MPGIITSTGGAGSVHTYRAVFTSTSTSLAINWVSGTTSGTIASAADKGIYVTFQNQSTAASVTIGGPDVTVNAQGIVLGPFTTGAATQQVNTYTAFGSGSPCAINMAEWYVTTTSSVGAIVAQLLKGV